MSEKTTDTIDGGATRGTVVEPEQLGGVMELDTVAEVTAAGSVVVRLDVMAPEYVDDELYTDGAPWAVQSGWTGQYGYSGPVNHDSEYIGGAMARHILATPGLWVAVPAVWTPDDDDDVTLEGWVLAYRPID